MLKVGLTGGIASGKSTASQLFQAQGIPVIDADRVARIVVEPGQPALQAIQEQFGEGVIQPDGTLDRRALRNIVFQDGQALKTLEQITHPRIRQYIVDWLGAQDAAYVILESPLLLETNQRELVDRVLLVDVPEALQIERTMARDNCSKEQAQAILSAQMTRSLRQELSDDIILNDSGQESLEALVLSQHQQYLDLSGA